MAWKNNQRGCFCARKFAFTLRYNKTKPVSNRFCTLLTSLHGYASKPHTRLEASSASKMSTIYMTHTFSASAAHMLPYVLVYSGSLSSARELTASAPLKQKCKFQRRRGVFCVCGTRTHQGVSTRSQRLKRFTHFAAARCMYNYCVVCVCTWLDIFPTGKWERRRGRSHTLTLREIDPGAE